MSAARDQKKKNNVPHSGREWSSETPDPDRVEKTHASPRLFAGQGSDPHDLHGQTTVFRDEWQA